MGCLWDAYGMPIGMPMGCLWDAYGMHMGCLWDAYGIPMGYLWDAYVIWDAYGMPVGYQVYHLGSYKFLIAVYGETYFLLWGCGLGPMGNLGDHAAAVWHVWETISP